jgi:hypothetical protein
MTRTRCGRALLPMLLVASTWPMSGCILDDDKCGPNQIAVSQSHVICACKPGSVLAPDDRSCVPCAANEEEVSGVCVCKEGFSRASAGEVCSESTIGTACSDAAPCASSAAPYCATSGAAEGYCTSTGCENSASCPQDWSCESAAEGRYCRRPPTGIGQACESDRDCAGFEARYCDSILTRSCLLAGCATGQATCPTGWGCCDYSPLGAALSICISPTQLQMGSCPQGGTLVSR